MESYRVGSVAWSMRYFADRQFTAAGLRDGRNRGQGRAGRGAQHLPARAPGTWPMARRAPSAPWAMCWRRPAGRPARSPAKDWTGCRSALLSAQSADRLRLEGMKEDRRAVIGGGVSVLRAVFDLLEIDRNAAGPGRPAPRRCCSTCWTRPRRRRICASTGATAGDQIWRRHGAWPARGKVASHLLAPARQRGHEACRGPSLNACCASSNGRPNCMTLAARISHSDYHKHGAYILDNADAMGFTLPELHQLGLLVLGHRGKLRKLR